MTNDQNNVVVTDVELMIVGLLTLGPRTAADLATILKADGNTVTDDAVKVALSRLVDEKILVPLMLDDSICVGLIAGRQQRLVELGI